MTFTYDPSTSLGRVRLLAIDSRGGAEAIFSDEEMQAFLDMNGANVYLAAADALDTMGADEAKVQKAIKLLDIQTNGPAVANVLAKRAQTLRAQARDDNGIGAFDVAQNPSDAFASADYALNWYNGGTIV